MTSGLPHAAAVDGHLGAGSQFGIQTVDDCRAFDVEGDQNLGNGPVLLFQQRQKDVLGVYLSVTIAAHDLVSTRGCVLGSFRKTIESHLSIVLDEITTD